MIEHPTCADARVWLSAFRDGEAMPDAASRAHIDTCAACTSWERTAAAVTRATAVQAAGAPDVTQAAIHTWHEQAAQARPRQWTIGRGVLALAGILGLTLSVLATIRGESAAHVGHDLAALEAALAVGCLCAAAWPDRYGRALLPVFGVAGLLTLLSAPVSLEAGATDLLVEASHLPGVIGFAGLFLVLDADGGLGFSGRPGWSGR